MNLGLGIGLTRQRGGLSPAVPFSPAALFAAGEQGGWYDPSDLASMSQNSDGTGAAAVGSPVGRMLDKSGRANHVTQATAAARPVLRQDAGGRYYLEADGVDDLFNFTVNPLAGSATATALWAFKRDVAAALTTDRSPLQGFGTAGLPEHEPYWEDGALYHSFGSTTRSALGALGAGLNAYVMRMERSATNLTATRSRTLVGTAATAVGWGAAPKLLAANCAGRFCGALMIGRTLTATEISQAENYLAAKAGITL